MIGPHVHMGPIKRGHPKLLQYCSCIGILHVLLLLQLRVLPKTQPKINRLKIIERFKRCYSAIHWAAAIDPWRSCS